MKNKPAMLFALLSSAVLLAACGQKGPLFLPGTPSLINTPVQAEQAAPAEDAEENNKQKTNNPN